MKKYRFHEVSVENINGKCLYCELNTRIPLTGFIVVDSQYSYLYFIQDGMYHNLNGPAVIRVDGKLEYWINDEAIGLNLSNKEFKQKIKEMIFK